MNQQTNLNKQRLMSTHSMVKISLLSAIAFVLMLFEFPLGIFPEFLKIDLSDLPALIGGFALGPVAGVVIVAIKNVLHVVIKSQTGGVGELANFIVGAALVFPASFVYAHKKSRKNALLGMILGVVCMSIAGAIANYYILIPFYTNFMPIEAIIDMSAAANAAIIDLKTLILYAIIPFNLVKGAIVTAITLIVYKKISPLLHR